MTKRKFYKTVITFEVLSEEPIPANASIEAIIEESTHGGYSMGDDTRNQTELNGKQAADELLKQGSEPEFFRIDETGKDLGEND